MSDALADNPRAVAGANVPDYAREETGRLQREFAETEREVESLLVEARAAPPRVDTEETASLYTRLIRRFRDLDTKVESFRESEKQPFLRRGDAVDSFFFGLRERLARRKKTDNPGGADILQARLHDYNEARRLEEQRRRDEAARIAREAEDAARRKREEEERQQREAEAKAARARKAENKEAAEREASEAAARAAAARAEEQVAREQRQETTAAAQAKPADLVRERHDSGAINTMRQVPYVEITDAMALDATALWPFVPDDAKLRALKAWAKVTQHKRAMPGAVIEMRNETVVR